MTDFHPHLAHTNGSLDWVDEKEQLELPGDTLIVRAGESPADAAGRKADEKPELERHGAPAA